MVTKTDLAALAAASDVRVIRVKKNVRHVSGWDTILRTPGKFDAKVSHGAKTKAELDAAIAKEIQVAKSLTHKARKGVGSH